MVWVRLWVVALVLLAVTVVALGGRNDEEYFRGQPNSISIIIATHNDARYRTLGVLYPLWWCWL
jgi:hypothetical protein